MTPWRSQLIPPALGKEARGKSSFILIVRKRKTLWSLIIIKLIKTVTVINLQSEQLNKLIYSSVAVPSNLGKYLFKRVGAQRIPPWALRRYPGSNLTLKEWSWHQNHSPVKVSFNLRRDQIKQGGTTSRLTAVVRLWKISAP